MSVPFNSQQGLIVIDAELEGPAATISLRLAVDTGAVRTLLRDALLIAVGHDPAQSTQQTRMLSASGIQPVALVTVLRLKALEQERQQFPVIAHTLPAAAAIDGLLGLDFYRGQKLDIDFRQGLITLS
jgi:predicted aspartyl protease